MEIYKQLINRDMHIKYSFCFLIVFVVLFNSAAVQSIEVVANATNSIDTLSKKQLRRIYTMRQVSWDDGTPIVVLVLPSKHQTHKDFSKEYLNVFPYQLERIWDRLIFSGLGVGPVLVATQDALLAQVSSTPGAIGYVNNFEGGVDVITINIEK